MPINGPDVLIKTQQRDHELDCVALKQRFTLIRVSHDQFSYKSGGYFSEECLSELLEILRDPHPGVYRIGVAYREV